MFVNSLQNQIKWFLANTWTETLTDGSAICCCQVKNQENWHWLHCWEGNYSCDKICKPMHYAYMWNGFLFIGFLLANQSLTDARAICCHTTKSILPCYLLREWPCTLPLVGMHWEKHPPRTERLYLAVYWCIFSQDITYVCTKHEMFSVQGIFMPVSKICLWRFNESCINKWKTSPHSS